MLTQISFTADDKLKEKAMRKAKEKGLTLKSILILSMEAFADEKISFGIVPISPDVEALNFDSPDIMKKSKELANLLK
jgi:purine-nucleoside phosphorylase